MEVGMMHDTKTENNPMSQAQKGNDKNFIYFAHSANDNGEWHVLKEHLLGTANRMREFTSTNEYVKLFYQTGLAHDLGKYQERFQKYLIDGGQRGSVPHAAWGAGFARLLKQTEMAFAVDGHHKGLPDKAELQVDTEEYKGNNHPLNKNVKSVFLHDIGKTESDFMPSRFELPTLDRELLIRYLFSALTDADWLDTEQHFQQARNVIRAVHALDYASLITKLEEEMARKSIDGNINKLRNMVREYAISKADLPCGFFSLNLPTGLGKTLTSVSWALRHAQKNGLKRIIIVLPFINIIDQTAKELKRIFGEEWVLEHHSAYNEEEIKNETVNKEIDTKKLATENWDYPIIVTTTVQFFDSLFSNSPRRCRKNHNISESVVIFDEVQSLPKELITPTISILESMNRIMKTSFLFCTATQPAFERRHDFDEGITNLISLVDKPDQVYGQTKRVNYKPINDFNSVAMEELMQIMIKEEQSILAIYNTKGAALKAFLLAKNQTVWEVFYHLSTSMCPDHRKKVIEQIKEDLGAGKKIFVTSTQLIEAGVDLDFPCVYREIAPLESIIQSAGRCNREGKLNIEGELGNVYIFQLEEDKFPDELYKTLSQYTLGLLRENINKLYAYDFFTRYYADAVKLFVDTDKKQINVARSEYNFETVSNAYHLIDNKTISLFIANYNRETLNFIDVIKYKPFLTREDYRYMQKFSVQVYDDFLRKTKGQWEEKVQGYYVWFGSYSKDTGISPEPNLADFIQ
jgi:CRISPR-associated endonuclease/helicase Cas3